MAQEKDKLVGNFWPCFHLSPHLTPPEFRTNVFYSHGLCKFNVAIFTNYSKSAKSWLQYSILFMSLVWNPICQEIWSSKTCGHGMWRKGKRTPRWCARGEEKLAHLPIDGAEFWTRTIFDDVSGMRKWAAIKSWLRHNKQDTPFVGGFQVFAHQFVAWFLVCHMGRIGGVQLRSYFTGSFL